MDGHLVPVKVRVESGADERVDPNRLPLNEDGLECLDAQPVQRRCAVEKDRVIADDVLKHFVDFRVVFLDDLLRPLDSLGLPPPFEFVNDERFEELDGHRLREATLMELELWPHNDDGAAGIVHPLPEEVLPEASLLSLQHVGEGLERPLPAPADRLGPAAVVKERVDRLLKHPFLVPENHLRRPHLDQLLEPVVAVDHAPVEVIQVRGRKPPPVEGNKRPQVRGDDRDHIHDHPLGPVSLVERAARVPEGVDHPEALELLLLTVLRGLGPDLLTKPLRQPVEALAVLVFLLHGPFGRVEEPEKRADRLRPDLGLELLVPVLARLHAHVVVLVLI